mmetsp:Transcript_7303/g.10717  ORF Transcript_7303/g.10717 Transcript_7303/m.10717 type:complete len:139 (-) Transcript_7303:79-495(-)
MAEERGVKILAAQSLQSEGLTSVRAMVVAVDVQWQDATSLPSRRPSFASSMVGERNVHIKVAKGLLGVVPRTVQAMAGAFDASWMGAIEWRLGNCSFVERMVGGPNPRRGTYLLPFRCTRHRHQCQCSQTVLLNQFED